MTTPLPIDRRSNLSKSEFAHEYLIPRKPVVLTDLMRGCKVCDWTHAMFKSRFGTLNVAAYAYKPGFQEPRSKQMPLARYIDLVTTDQWKTEWHEGYPPPYLERWMDFDPEFGSLRSELSRDYVIPPHFENHSRFLPKWLRRVGLSTQIFIGPSGTIAWLHQDSYMVHSWALCIQGSKRWVLFDPNQTQYLYNSGFHSPVDADNPDLERYPLFRHARPSYEVIQNPGEVIFLPCGWWHQVTGTSSSISLGGSFTDRTNTARYVVEVVKALPKTAKRLFKASAGVSKQ